jgi:hypothetical protein
MEESKQFALFSESEVEDEPAPNQLRLLWTRPNKIRCPFRVSLPDGPDRCSFSEMRVCNYEVYPIIPCEIWEEIVDEWVNEGIITDENDKQLTLLRNEIK